METILKTEQESTKNFYKTHKEEMILRDILAADRTILANERTFLSYVRTSLSIAVAGVSFIKIFENLMMELLGGSFVISAIIILFVGVQRYLKINKDLSFLKK